MSFFYDNSLTVNDKMFLRSITDTILAYDMYLAKNRKSGKRKEKEKHA